MGLLLLYPDGSKLILHWHSIKCLGWLCGRCLIAGLLWTFVYSGSREMNHRTMLQARYHKSSGLIGHQCSHNDNGCGSLSVAWHLCPFTACPASTSKCNYIECVRDYSSLCYRVHKVTEGYSLYITVKHNPNELEILL